MNPFDGHDIDLDRGKAGFLGLPDSREDGPELPAPRDLCIFVGVQRIETDVDPADSRGIKPLRAAFQEDAVRRQADVVQFRYPPEGGDELHDPPADQRLAAGDPDLGDPFPRRDPDDPVDLLIAEDVVVADPGNAFLGHAVGAAEVAAVRDGNPQIIDIPFVLIDHVPG